MSEWAGASIGRAKENERTYLIECKHLPCHLPAVVEGYSHAVVDQVLHLALLVRHGAGGAHECDLDTVQEGCE